MKGLSKETIAAFETLEPVCQSGNCLEDATVVIYDRLRDRLLPPGAPIALTYACAQHIAAMRWAVQADWDDIEHLPKD